MEATCSSELSVDFQRTTRRYILEDGTVNENVIVQVAGNKQYISIAWPSTFSGQN
jgi:hypothetical protein